LHKIGKIKLILVIMGATILLFSCSGVMKGMIQGEGELVNFQFEDTGYRSGEIKTTLPDGEKFEGKFVEEWVSAHDTGYETVDAYSGHVEAILFGDKGHTMKCRFRTEDELGLLSGGIGRCQVSDGRVIDVQF
jgi:hypothetical protein